MSNLTAKSSAPDSSPAPSPGSTPLGEFPRGALARSIAREARLHYNQTVELKMVADGVLIRPVLPRLSLAERLAGYTPMEREATEAMAWDPIGTEVIE